MKRWLQPQTPGDDSPEAQPRLPDLAPQPGPQSEAARSAADELLYGGAAGGGKTYLVVALAIMAHSRSIIFRREFPQLSEITDLLDELLDGICKPNRNRARWTMLDGRFVELGSMQRTRDWRKFKGRPHDLVVFDELSEFSREQFRMSLLWNRTHLPHQRCRAVATTNPPTSEAERWIIEEWAPWLDPEFPDPAEPGELRWYTYDGDRIVWRKQPGPIHLEVETGRVVIPKSRTFIPARLEDNPILEATGYGRMLDALPAELRAAFRDGDFTALSTVDPFQVIPTAWIRAAMARERPATEDLPPLDQVGVDPARGGKDSTTVARRRGHVLDELLQFPGKATPDGPTVAGHVLLALEPERETDPETGELLPIAVPVSVDVIGIGSAVYDALVANDVYTVAFNASESSDRRDRSGQLRMKNRRAAAYWHLRELLDPETGEDLVLPNDQELLAELAAPRWKPTVRGVQLEAKDAIKERLGRSPDKADAVVCAFDEIESPLYVV